MAIFVECQLICCWSLSAATSGSRFVLEYNLNIKTDDTILNCFYAIPIHCSQSFRQKSKYRKQEPLVKRKKKQDPTGFEISKKFYKSRYEPLLFLDDDLPQSAAQLVCMLFNPQHKTRSFFSHYSFVYQNVFFPPLHTGWIE